MLTTHPTSAKVETHGAMSPLPLRAFMGRTELIYLDVKRHKFLFQPVFKFTIFNYLVLFKFSDFLLWIFFKKCIF
jgi:hypothetical protein